MQPLAIALAATVVVAFIIDNQTEGRSMRQQAIDLFVIASLVTLLVMLGITFVQDVVRPDEPTFTLPPVIMEFIPDASDQPHPDPDPAAGPSGAGE